MFLYTPGILSIFRTSQQKTLSLHLFNVVVVVDRIMGNREDQKADIPIETFIPSIEEQITLMMNLFFFLLLQ